VEAHQAEKNKELVAYFERQSDETLRSVRWMAGELDAYRKRAQVTRVLAQAQPVGNAQPSENGDAK
jgi:hypothetical protein